MNEIVDRKNVLLHRKNVNAVPNKEIVETKNEDVHRQKALADRNYVHIVPKNDIAGWNKENIHRLNDDDEDGNLFPDEVIRFHRVAADAMTRMRLDGETERDGEISRPVAVVRHAKSQRARPAPQIAVNRVKLVLQPSVHGVEIVRGAETPVVIHAQKHRAADEIVAAVQESGARIHMAEAPAPPFVRREGDLMIGQVEMAVVDVVTRLGLQREPRARPEREAGIKIVERVLAGGRVQPPVEQHIPVEQIFQLAGALGLERVAQAEADDVLAVNRINVVVIGKLDGQQQRAWRHGIELRQLWRQRAGSRHKRVTHQRLDDVAQAVHVQQRICRAGPEPRGFEGNVHAGVENFPVGLAVRATRPGFMAVIGEPPAGARRDVQPAEKCFRQQQLLERVGARRGIIKVRAVRAGE